MRAYRLLVAILCLAMAYANTLAGNYEWVAAGVICAALNVWAAGEDYS